MFWMIRKAEWASTYARVIQNIFWNSLKLSKTSDSFQEFHRAAQQHYAFAFSGFPGISCMDPSQANVRKVPTYDVFTRKLQDCLIQTIEAKLQLHETQKAQIAAGSPQYAQLPALSSIKEPWTSLIYPVSPYKFLVNKLHRFRSSL